MSVATSVEAEVPSSEDRRTSRVNLSPWVEVMALLSVSGGAVVGAQVLGPTTAAGNTVAVLGLLGAVGLVFLFRWLKSEPWSELGLVRPDSWKRTILLALAATLVLQGVGWFASDVVMPYFTDTTPDVSRFDALRGNLKFLLGSLVSIWVTAAFIEEVVFRGFLIGRLAKMFGGSRQAWIAGLVLSSVVFGLLHVYQGVSGVLMTGFIGFLLGVLYLAVRRNLWVAILAHGLVDTVSLVMIYLGFG